MNITVNLVDDHKVVTEGLSFILSSEEGIEVLDTAQTGAMALAQMTERTPDVVILDYSLSEEKGSEITTGLDLAKIIMERHPSVKIMMLTMHNNPEIIVPCVTAGVHGYMLKSEENADFAAAIRQLMYTGCYFSPSVARDLALGLRKRKNENIALTEREKEVLECLYKGSSTKEIAEELFISHHTVDSHRKNLIHKFEAKNSVHLIYLALKQGILRV
ncbi:MAG TPA: response regulator transcription factor [Cryomorphaceae bacterium]|nr:response regulator transcription factor [Cryomorphaceae bacterium]